MISTVVFDFGGVISQPQHGDVVYPWAERQTGLTEADYKKAYMTFRQGFDRGDYSGQEMYRRILTAAGKSFDDELLDGLYQRDMDSWAFANLETYGWAKELKAAGFKIAILTNMPVCFIPWYNRTAEKFRALADTEIISAEVGMIKPDEKIYKLLIERTRESPEKLLFFDDTQINVDGARATGINSEIFTTVEQAKRELLRYNDGSSKNIIR